MAQTFFFSIVPSHVQFVPSEPDSDSGGGGEEVATSSAMDESLAAAIQYQVNSDQ